MLPVVGIGTEWVEVGKTNFAYAPGTSIEVRANICEGLYNALNNKTVLAYEDDLPTWRIYIVGAIIKREFEGDGCRHFFQQSSSRRLTVN